jgi:hypothetical protein
LQESMIRAKNYAGRRARQEGLGCGHSNSGGADLIS